MNTREIVTAAYKTYVDKDRAALEKLISREFRFTSPLDDSIDRAAYFERCWPNSEAMASQEIERMSVDGEAAFVTYECVMKDGRRFRNTEHLITRSGQLTNVEVYFGWSIPHSAAVPEKSRAATRRQPSDARTSTIDNALASLAVKDLTAALPWYESALGTSADSARTPELAQWTFAGGGGLQVYALPERAGSGSCTLAVSDIESQAIRLGKLGIPHGVNASSTKVKTIMIKDPDGNSIAFAQALDAT